MPVPGLAAAPTTHVPVPVVSSAGLQLILVRVYLQKTSMLLHLFSKLCTLTEPGFCSQHSDMT